MSGGDEHHDGPRGRHSKAQLDDRRPPRLGQEGSDSGTRGDAPRQLVDPAVVGRDPPQLEPPGHWSGVDQERTDSGRQPAGQVGVGLLGGTGENGQQVAELEQRSCGMALEDGAVGLLHGVVEDGAKGLGGLELLDDGQDGRPKRGQGADRLTAERVGDALGQGLADAGRVQRGDGAVSELFAVEDGAFGP